jgi:hypothetical protein
MRAQGGKKKKEKKNWLPDEGDKLSLIVGSLKLDKEPT